MILLVETVEIASVERFANLSHKLVVEIEVMRYGKHHAEGLLCLDKVADVGAAVMAAGGAVAVFVDGTGVAGIFFVAQVHLAVPGEHISVPSVP